MEKRKKEIESLPRIPLSLFLLNLFFVLLLLLSSFLPSFPPSFVRPLIDQVESRVQVLRLGASKEPGLLMISLAVEHIIIMKQVFVIVIESYFFALRTKRFYGPRAGVFFRGPDFLPSFTFEDVSRCLQRRSGTKSCTFFLRYIFFFENAKRQRGRKVLGAPSPSPRSFNLVNFSTAELLLHIHRTKKSYKLENFEKGPYKLGVVQWFKR